MLFNQNSLLLRQPKPPRALYRSGLLVGLEDARSAPMNGIVPIPPWAYPIKEVIDQAGLLPEKLKPIFCSMVQHSIWTAFQLTGPGIREMRQGHPLLVKFNDSLDKLAERSRFPQGFTALSVTNTNDPFVEPNSSLFGSPERRRSPNVFTLGIDFPNSWVKPSGRQAIDERFRYFPKPIRSAVHKKLGYFEKVYQRHGFTVGRPDVVNRILPAAFLNYPSQFIDLMQPSNFEPMQIQMLKHFQSVLTQPDSVMSQALLQHDYFDVMQVLQALYHQTTPLQQSLRKEITEAIEAMLAFAEENSRKIASAPIPQKAPLLNALRLLLEDKSGAFDALHSRVEVLREYLDR